MTSSPSPQHPCPACQKELKVSPSESGFLYCPFCAAKISGKVRTGQLPPCPPLPDTPAPEKIQFTLGSYQIFDTIGKGGMGKVYKAFDTTCGRVVALKEIRPDLKKYRRLHERFLHEARITSQLTHPAIMPIYAIHYHDDRLYYTMPYVPGETLKARFRRARERQKEGKTVEHAHEIAALSRPFLSLCQAMAYAHSHGIIHRDLKPENVMLGEFGEVLLLDWGLAQPLDEPPVEGEMANTEDECRPHQANSITIPGRIVGTLNYMSPERALGNPADISTDIYALGVILYQLLTLRMPFHRESFKSYRKNWKEEGVPTPEEDAPYRNIPRVLSRVVRKCLDPDPEQRYQSVEEMVHDLENYAEGRSEWFMVAHLDPQQKEHWEFQEHIFIPEHIAITRKSEKSDWVHLMVSKGTFSGDTQLRCKIRLGPESEGLGFLLNIPERSKRETPYDGYCLWLGSDLNRTTRLMRSSQEVLDATDIFLKREQWYDIRIEKKGNRLTFFLNGRLQLSFVSHMPIAGTHAGLLSKDFFHAIKDLEIYVSSLSLKVDCLAVPNAFLANKDFATARAEYKRISEAFPDRTEGREALFRSGVSFIEQARHQETTKEQQPLLDAALEEFEQLRDTPGAPLEYLGKGLVYREERDFLEEVKCYELAYRRYKNHPMLPALQEQIIYRMQETARHNRLAAYHFILLALRHIPSIAKRGYLRRLLKSLKQHWEPLPFWDFSQEKEEGEKIEHYRFSLTLAFWCGKPYAIEEILQDVLEERLLYTETLCNGLMCLIELGSHQLAIEKMEEILEDCFDSDREHLERPFHLLAIAANYRNHPLKSALEAVLNSSPAPFSPEQLRIALYLFDHALYSGKAKQIPQACERLLRESLSEQEQLRVEGQAIQALLYLGKTEEAKEWLSRYSTEELCQEDTPLFTLYGCWIAMEHGEEKAKEHFSKALDHNFPRSWSLLGQFLNGKIHEHSRWFRFSFMWERRQLYRQLAFYHRCLKNPQKEQDFQTLEQKEYSDVTH